MTSDNQQLFLDSVEYDLLTSDSGKSILEKYALGRRMHEGAQSRVFALVGMDSGKRFVLKAIPRNGGDSHDIFAQKNLLLSGLPQIHDVFHTDRYVYVVREFIEGVTLSEMVQGNGPLDEAEAVRLCISLCDSLAKLHHMSPPLVFRDVKPDNIVLTPSGEVKLIDTESIRTHDAEASTDTVYIGTEGYAAPEQYGYAQTDARTDVYGLGATLAYLLTGKKPERVSYGIKRVSSINLSCTERISDIIDKCTAFHPDSRYQSIDDAKRDLTVLLIKDTRTQEDPQETSQTKKREAGRTVKNASWLLRLSAAAAICVMILLVIVFASNGSIAKIFLGTNTQVEMGEANASIQDIEEDGDKGRLPTSTPVAVDQESTVPVNTASISPTAESVPSDGIQEGGDLKSDSTASDSFFDKTTIIEAFWSGEIPQKAPAPIQDTISENFHMFYNPAICFISIVEWELREDPQTIHEQMGERIEKVGGDFVFTAEGYPDIRASANGGSVTFNDGSGLYYYLYIENHEDVVAGVNYRIASTSGHWIVNEDVRIVKPAQ